MENSMEVQKITHRITIDSTSSIHPKELKAGTQNKYLNIHVHSSVIHNSQKMEATQGSING